MRVLLLSIALSAVPFLSQAQKQKILYASKVVDFSSEFSFELYSAQQILGEPNALPTGGDSPFAWSPKRQTGKQDITVAFGEDIEIEQVAIGECLNPGAVHKVFAIEASGMEHMLNEYTPRPIRQDSRLLHLILEERTPYKVHAIRVELDGDKVPGYNSIDFIAIADGKTPVEVKINDASQINPNINTERLTEKINSPYDEVNPIISPDGKRLYFGRKNDPGNAGGKKDDEDIWYSDWDDAKGEWGIAKNLGSPINNNQPNFMCSITPDGKNVIIGNVYKFDKQKVKMTEGVSMVTIGPDGVWSRPKEMKIKGYFNDYKKVSYYLCQNRKTMLMSIRAENALGENGTDLYVSFMESDSTWSKPVHTGQVINSVGNETAPFLAADDKTMFFSSDGFAGYGKEDIFMTRRLDDSWLKWSKPQNLGPNINTKESDIFFTLPANGDYAYFSSGGKEAGGQLDLFRLRIPELFKPKPVVEIRGKVLDKFSNKPIRAKILYESLTNDKQLGFNDSDPKTGDYKLAFPVGDNYGYLAQAVGYLSVTQNLDASKLEEGQVIEQNLYLMPIKKGSQVALNNIFFDYNKSELKKESYPELNRLVKMMKDNPKLRIAIGGHTDSRGSNTYNMKLSSDRAASVKQYLQKKGIDPSRMNIKTMGSTTPLTANEASPDGAALNRRVDITIEE